MAAGTYDITIEQGAAFDAVFTYEDTTGNPVPLAGWSAKMQIRRFAGGTVLAELSTADGRIILGASDGTVRVHLPASATAAITIPGVWDLDLVPPSGADDTVRLLGGRMRLRPAVTSA